MKRRVRKTLKTKATKVPNCMEKRELLNAKDVSPEVLTRYGDLCFEHGKLNDAFEFYAAARDSEGLTKIKRVAIDEGLAYLLFWLGTRTDQPVSVEEWKETADRAQELGKITLADLAHQKAGLASPDADSDPALPPANT